MTPEGVIMIIILCFALIKFVQGKMYSLGISPIKKQLLSKSALETFFFFTFSTIAGLATTNLIVGLILINAIAWTVYHVFLKSLGYSFISWLSLVMFWLYVHATYITFSSIPFTEIWYFTLFSWGINLLLVLLFDTLGKYIKVFREYQKGQKL